MTKLQVWRSNDPRAHTSGGLRRSDLMVNKRGKVVSKRQHEAGKRAFVRNKLKPKTREEMAEMRGQGWKMDLGKTLGKQMGKFALREGAKRYGSGPSGKRLAYTYSGGGWKLDLGKAIGKVALSEGAKRYGSGVSYAGRNPDGEDMVFVNRGSGWKLDLAKTLGKHAGKFALREGARRYG